MLRDSCLEVFQWENLPPFTYLWQGWQQWRCPACQSLSKAPFSDPVSRVPGAAQSSGVNVLLPWSAEEALAGNKRPVVILCRGKGKRVPHFVNLS
jgi:hypothetical protein